MARGRSLAPYAPPTDVEQVATRLFTPGQIRKLKMCLADTKNRFGSCLRVAWIPNSFQRKRRRMESLFKRGAFVPGFEENHDLIQKSGCYGSLSSSEHLAHKPEGTYGFRGRRSSIDDNETIIYTIIC